MRSTSDRRRWLSLAAGLLGCVALPPRPADDPLPSPPPGAGAPAAAVARLGPPIVLLGPGRLDLRYFPDQAVTVLARSPRVRLLVAAGDRTHLVEGRDLEHLDRSEPVLGRGPRGAFDAGYAGVGGAVEHAGLIYAAYHAEDHEGMPALPGTGGVPGFHASVGLAVSSDGGRNWTKLGPVLTSFRPKGWTSYRGQADTGVGEPWLTRSADGAWWLLYYAEHGREGGRGVQICLARASAGAPPAPGAFRKWYEGAFSEPGLGGRDTPVLSALAFDDADAFGAHVVWSAALERYVLTFDLNAWREYQQRSGLRRSGIYLATSEDGVRWSRPEPLLVDWAVDVVGLSVSWHPALVFDEGSSTEGWLLYGHSDRWDPAQGIPPHLVGRRIALAPRVAATPPRPLRRSASSATARPR